MMNSSKTAEKNASYNAAKPSGKQGCIRIFCVALVLMFVLPVATWLISESLNSRSAKLNARHTEQIIAAIAERGEPVETAELDAFYVLPEGAVNTQHSWIAACNRFNSSEYFEDAKTIPFVGVVNSPTPFNVASWNSAEFETAKALLEKYDKWLQLIHGAATNGGYARFDRRFQLGYNMPIAYVQMLRQCSRLLKLEAFVALHRGDSNAAAKSLSSMFGIGRALEFDPIMLSQTEQYELDWLAIELLLELLPQADWSDAQLAQFQHLLRKPDYRSGLRRALIGERVMAIQAFRDPQILAVAWRGSGGDPDFSSLIPEGATQDKDLGLYVDLMAEMIAGLDNSWTDAVDTSSRVMAKLKKSVVSYEHPYRMTGLIFPSLENYCNSAATADARRKLADALIATERYKSKHQIYPESIESVVPEFLSTVPIDPFDNQPIRYTLREQVPFVWSVNVNRVDDNGRRNGQEMLDLAITLQPLRITTIR